MPRLNELVEKYGDQGLVVIGVSDEDESKLESYVDDKKPKFTIVRASRAMDAFGGKFYPSFFTIGADNKILSVPDERIPPEALIEGALKSVVLLNDLPDNAQMNKLRAAFEKRKWKDVAEWFEDTLAKDDLDADLRAKLEAHKAKFYERIQRELTAIEKMREATDYYAAYTKLTSLARDWKGMPIAKSASSMLAELQRDGKIKKEIDAGKMLDRLLRQYDVTRTSDRRKLTKALEAFRKRYGGTHAAGVAETQIAKIARME